MVPSPYSLTWCLPQSCRWHSWFPIDPSRTLLLLRESSRPLGQCGLLDAVSRSQVLEEGIPDIEVTKKKRTSNSFKRSTVRMRKMSCVKPCAEDFLSKSEIKIDVLKEEKMFYISTRSLLERNMRSTALQAIKISKKFGGLIFYDVNLPMLLWRSDEETRMFIQIVWELADIVEERGTKMQVSPPFSYNYISGKRKPK